MAVPQGMCCTLWCRSRQSLLTVREWLLPFLRAALMIHWHGKAGYGWTLWHNIKALLIVPGISFWDSDSVLVLANQSETCSCSFNAFFYLTLVHVDGKTTHLHLLSIYLPCIWWWNNNLAILSATSWRWHLILQLWEHRQENSSELSLHIFLHTGSHPGISLIWS